MRNQLLLIRAFQCLAVILCQVSSTWIRVQALWHFYCDFARGNHLFRSMIDLLILTLVLNISKHHTQFKDSNGFSSDKPYQPLTVYIVTNNAAQIPSFVLYILHY